MQFVITAECTEARDWQTVKAPNTGNCGTEKYWQMKALSDAFTDAKVNLAGKLYRFNEFYKVISQ